MHQKNKPLKDLAKKVKGNKRKLIIILALIFISLIPVSLLLMPGFPITDDGTWLVIRFSAFFETLRSGQIPVRNIYRLDDGMGYPVSNFLYPLYLYLATPFHIIGLNFLNSIKALLILNIFLSSIFTFFWLNKKFNNISSFLGSVALVLSPYFLFDIYKRGSVGELLTFSIVPFILWQIERKSFIFISIGISLLVLAHNTLAFLFLLLIIFYSVISKHDLKLIVKSLILGLGLSAFFWIPALFDLSKTTFLNTKVSGFYDYLFKISDLYLIGISGFTILISGIVIAHKVKQNKDKFFLYSIIISIFIIFLQLPQSKLIWEIFPFRDFIQFPFRLISILTILFAFQTAYITDKLKKYQIVFISILLLVLIFQSVLILKNVKFENYEDGFYSTNQSSTTVLNEYRNKWLIKPEINQEKFQIITGIGSIDSITMNPGKVSLLLNLKTNGIIQINSAYFPDWKAKINNKEVEIDYIRNGLIRLEVPVGQSEVKVFYQQSVLHKISNSISIISILVMCFYSLMIIYNRSKKVKL